MTQQKKEVMNKKLELLQSNHSGAMLLNNGMTVNYRVIRRQHDRLVYFTDRGIREMYKPQMNEEQRIQAADLKNIYSQEDGEERLKASGHIQITFLNNIERVLL